MLATRQGFELAFESTASRRAEIRHPRPVRSIQCELVASNDYSRTGSASANSGKVFESNAVAEKEGFEPSFDPMRLVDRAGLEHAEPAPGETPL